MWILNKLFKQDKPLQTIDITKRFNLMNRIGQGTMSQVWKAHDTHTNAIVCLKVLDKEKTLQLESKFKGLDKPTEGEIAVQLKHPHIVETMEHGLTHDQEQFLVMEYIDSVGISVYIEMQNDVMKKYRLQWIKQLGSALEYFHRQHFIHRDLCPRNIIIDREYNLKLIDFGLAVPDRQEFKEPGNRTGTAIYMAPELIKRRKTDQRIDIFSFAVTCFEMWTGRLPFDGGETIQVLIQNLNHPPKEIRKLAPDINPNLARIIMKGLKQDPKDRWSSMHVMFKELERVTESP